MRRETRERNPHLLPMLDCPRYERCSAPKCPLHPRMPELDEPTDGLDPNQKYEVRQLIGRLASDKCIAISTHILEEVDAVCSRIIIINEGKILVNSTPQQLRKEVGGTLDEIFRKLTTQRSKETVPGGTK